MKIVLIGLGNQGSKRKKIASSDYIASVDPNNTAADYTDIRQVPLDRFDAALLCTPDTAKSSLIKYLIMRKKHVLVEKPLLLSSTQSFVDLAAMAKKHQTVCYVAYNHSFEPHFINMKKLIQNNTLGKIYHCRLFYGNGTAQSVKSSPWRDTGSGVLADLGSHVLFCLYDWFGEQILKRNFIVQMSRAFETNAPDHVVFADYHAHMTIEAEVSLLSWQNSFSCDIIAEHGSAHINSLCKWGPSQFIVRQRTLPCGRPTEKINTLVMDDPTWQLEYDYFKNLCTTEEYFPNFKIQCWLARTLTTMSKAALHKARIYCIAAHEASNEY